MAGMECKGFPVRRTAVAPAGPLRGSGAQPQRGKGAEPLKDVVFDLKSLATKTRANFKYAKYDSC